MIKIDKNVPLPVKEDKYPFAAMEIGDSFFITGVDSTHISRCYGGFARRKPGVKFTCAQEGDGLRVWRIA